MKKFFLMVITFILVLVGSTWMSNVTFCAFADELNDEIPLAGTLQYEEWKQNYLNQSARSVFGSRLTETVRVGAQRTSLTKEPICNQECGI